MTAATAHSGITISLPALLKLRLSAGALDLTSRHRLVMTSTAGAYLSGFRGRGMDFVEVRSYQPGDDIRSIDWRVTARTGKPHTKLYREERERPVFIVVDYSPSMFFGTQVAFKSVIAAQVAALLAWAAAINGDRVGGLVFNSDQHIELRPGNGQRGVFPLLKTLAHSEPFAASNTSENALPNALLRLRHIARPGSLIFVISDFLHYDQALNTQLSQLALHNEIATLFIYDALEAKLPPNDQYAFSDGKDRLVLDTDNRQLLANYHSQFEQRLGNLQLMLRKYGISCLPIATHQDPLALLRQHWPSQTQRK